MAPGQQAVGELGQLAVRQVVAAPPWTSSGSWSPEIGRRPLRGEGVGPGTDDRLDPRNEGLQAPPGELGGQQAPQPCVVGRIGEAQAAGVEPVPQQRQEEWNLFS